MITPTLNMIKRLRSACQLAMILATLAGAFLACGVRGDPQPPITPPELGRGQPTYHRATEDMAFPDVPSVEDDTTAIKNKKNPPARTEDQ